VELIRWLLAVALIVAAIVMPVPGIVKIVRGVKANNGSQLAWGILLLVPIPILLCILGFLVGPGGVSVFS
jgi:hypothetical protein